MINLLASRLAGINQREPCSCMLHIRVLPVTECSMPLYQRNEAIPPASKTVNEPTAVCQRVQRVLRLRTQLPGKTITRHGRWHRRCGFADCGRLSRRKPRVSVVISCSGRQRMLCTVRRTVNRQPAVARSYTKNDLLRVLQPCTATTLYNCCRTVPYRSRRTLDMKSAVLYSRAERRRAPSRLVTWLVPSITVINYSRRYPLAIVISCLHTTSKCVPQWRRRIPSAKQIRSSVGREAEGAQPTRRRRSFGVKPWGGGQHKAASLEADDGGWPLVVWAALSRDTAN